MKKLSNTELEEKAAEVFKHNPQLKKGFITDDGTVFISKFNALNHARTLGESANVQEVEKKGKVASIVAEAKAAVNKIVKPTGKAGKKDPEHEGLSEEEIEALKNEAEAKAAAELKAKEEAEKVENTGEGKKNVFGFGKSK